MNNAICTLWSYIMIYIQIGAKERMKVFFFFNLVAKIQTQSYFIILCVCKSLYICNVIVKKLIGPT